MSKVNDKIKVALVLGGGGARGLAHIGVLKELERLNIKFDLIVGTSMGAIIGALYMQLENAEAVERKVLEFLDDYLAKNQWLKNLDPDSSDQRQSLIQEISYFVHRRYMALKALTRKSLEPQESLYEPLSKLIDNNNIEDYRLKFAAVCVDIRAGETVVLDKGSVLDAVYASAAIEGVFPPLEYDGKYLSDGGPVHLTPVDVASSKGAKRIIAVEIIPKIKSVDKFASGLEIILRADNIGLNRLQLKELAKADLVVSPDVDGIHWASFSKSREIIKKGEIAARENAKAISKIGSRLYWLTMLGKKFAGD